MNTFQWFEVSYMIFSVGLILLLQNDISNLKKQLVNSPTFTPKNEESNRLKLQALERLTIFIERCGLKNLVTRSESSNMTAPDLHHWLMETIKSEYDYNSSQQIYVSPEIWNAVTRMKDQNIYIINHITANLPPHATGLDLAKLIIEYSLTPQAEMSTMVLEALQYEAQKILK